MTARFLLAFFALFLVPAAAPAALRPAEQRMIATVDAEQARTLGMLERWVNQNSGSHNLAGVEAVGRMVRAELEPLGFTVRWVPLPQTGRAGHLIATHNGAPGRKRLLLIGHLDTVFELDSPFQRWERQRRPGSWAWGGRRQGRHGGYDRRAACDARRRHFARRQYRDRAHRRRGRFGHATGACATRSGRGRQARRRSARFRRAGAGQWARHGLDRAARRGRLDASGQRPKRAFERGVLADCRLWRQLRAGADRRCVPARTPRGQV